MSTPAPTPSWPARRSDHAVGSNGVSPLLVGKTTGAVSLIERVQTSVEGVAELKRLPNHHFGHPRVFTLEVAKHVDALPERQRLRIERFRQR